MINKLLRRLVKISAVAQFVSGKLSILFSSITMATVLSLKFHVPFYIIFPAIVLFGVLAVAVVLLSGWYKKELKYVGDNMINKDYK